MALESEPVKTYPYPCPKCREAEITQDMDEMGSACPKCFYDRDAKRVLGS